MRNIFLALVLANLAFAAWHSWFAAPVRFAAPEPPGVAGITLASEAGAADRVIVAPQPIRDTPLREDELIETGLVEAEIPELPPAASVAAATPAANQVCIQVGPFRELSQAATAAANMRADGLAPTQRATEGDIWVGYWVYIERIENMDQAESILAELKDNGITDPYIIPRSDSGTLISLGVYSEIARAGNRREQVQELGYAVTIADRTRRATVYWIEVYLEPGRLIDFERIQPPGRIVRLEQRPCDLDG